MRRSAGILVVNKKGDVLFQLRDNKKEIVYPNHWCLPGGQILDNESSEEAARRTLKTITGYNANGIKHLITESYERVDGEEVVRDVYWTQYDESQIIECLEGQDVKFIHPSDFKKLRFYPDHDRFAEWISKKIKLINNN